jgi:hypothetical protein
VLAGKLRLAPCVSHGAIALSVEPSESGAGQTGGDVTEEMVEEATEPVEISTGTQTIFDGENDLVAASGPAAAGDHTSLAGDPNQTLDLQQERGGEVDSSSVTDKESMPAVDQQLLQGSGQHEVQSGLPEDAVVTQTQPPEQHSATAADQEPRHDPGLPGVESLQTSAPTIKRPRGLPHWLLAPRMPAGPTHVNRDLGPLLRTPGGALSGPVRHAGRGPLRGPLAPLGSVGQGLTRSPHPLTMVDHEDGAVPGSETLNQRYRSIGVEGQGQPEGRSLPPLPPSAKRRATGAVAQRPLMPLARALPDPQALALAAAAAVADMEAATGAGQVTATAAAVPPVEGSAGVTMPRAGSAAASRPGSAEKGLATTSQQHPHSTEGPTLLKRVLSGLGGAGGGSWGSRSNCVSPSLPGSHTSHSGSGASSQAGTRPPSGSSAAAATAATAQPGFVTHPGPTNAKAATGGQSGAESYRSSSPGATAGAPEEPGIGSVGDLPLLPLPPMPSDAPASEGVRLQQPHLSASAPLGVPPIHQSHLSYAQHHHLTSSGALGIGSLPRSAQRRAVRFDQDREGADGAQTSDPPAILGLEPACDIAPWKVSAQGSNATSDDVHPWVAEQLTKLDRLLQGLGGVGGVAGGAGLVAVEHSAERVRRQLGGRPWYMDPALVAAPKVRFVNGTLKGEPAQQWHMRGFYCACNE